jgi:hypothetical protein
MKKLVLVACLLVICLCFSCDENSRKYKITYTSPEGEIEEWTLPSEKISFNSGFLHLYTKKGEIYLYGTVKVQEIKKEDKEKDDE